MTYAAHRRIIDVDSHLFELDDFLHQAAREEDLGLLSSVYDQTGLAIEPAWLDRARELFTRRCNEPQRERYRKP